MPRLQPILVIGGANLDLRCRVTRGYAAGTSNPEIVTTNEGGVAFNVACTLARLGAKVSLATLVGKDEPGIRILRKAQAMGVETSLCRRSRKPTGTYVALLDESGELVGAVSQMSILDEWQPGRMRHIGAALTVSDFVIADCNLPQSSLRYIAKKALRANVPLMIDAVSIAKAERLLGLIKSETPIFAISMNLGEAGAVSQGLRLRPSEPKRIASHLHQSNVTYVLINLGSRGVFVSTMTSSQGRQVAKTLRAKSAPGHDVTGAGDAALAATLFGLWQGLDIFEAAALGQVAAAKTMAGGKMRSQARKRSPSLRRSRT